MRKLVGALAALLSFCLVAPAIAHADDHPVEHTGHKVKHEARSWKHQAKAEKEHAKAKKEHERAKH